MKREDYFKEYFESIFKDSNTFSDEEYERHYKEYEANYKKFLPEQKDSVILDVGCGTGHFIYYLNKKGYTNFLGIDISCQQINFCKENISKKVMEIDAFEFLRDKYNVYDVIVANDFIEHLPKDKVIDFLSLAFKALKAKGKIILKTPNLGNPFSVRLRYVDFTHEVGFTEKSLYQVFWLVGFRDIKMVPFKNSGRGHKIFAGLISLFLRKIMWYQGFVAPNILTPLLVGVARK